MRASLAHMAKSRPLQSANVETRARAAVHPRRTRLVQTQTAELGSLLDEARPLERIGAMAIDDFLSLEDPGNLAAALNMLRASPSFASWRHGVSLNIREWLRRSRLRPELSISL
jgi:hypothetical protein